MPEKKPSRITRFLSFVVGALWYLILSSIIFVLGFWLAVLLGWAPARENIIYSLPIKVEYQESMDASFSPTGKSLSAFRVIGHSDVIIADRLTKTKVSLLVVSIVLPFLFVVWLIVHQLRLFLRSVKEGRPFDRENPKLIRRVGYLVFVLGPLEGLWSFVMSCKYIHQISLPGALLAIGKDSTMIVHADIDQNLIILGLLILLIAQIFDEGVKMQEEQDLTV